MPHSDAALLHRIQVPDPRPSPNWPVSDDDSTNVRVAYAKNQAMQGEISPAAPHAYRGGNWGESVAQGWKPKCSRIDTTLLMVVLTWRKRNQMFDIDTELDLLRRQTSEIRKKRYSRSRLDRYRGELLLLHRGGASVAELQRWLRARRIRVVHTTVARWIDKNGGS